MSDMDMDMDCTLPENMDTDYCKDMDDHEEEGDHGHGNPMMANVKYLMTAGFTMLGSALTFGRYRAADDWYTAINTALEVDYFEQADLVRHPVRIVLFGALFILQALSMAGIAVDINMMAWHYGMVVMMVSNLISMLLLLLAYDTAYSKYVEDTTTNAAYYDTMEAIGFQQKANLAKDTALVMGLYFAKKGWMQAQWDMLPEEKQKEMKDSKKDADDDMDDMLLSYYFRI